MNAEFFRHKTILVTGHTGFKGSWLSLWLQKLGANVVGFSLAPPSEPNLFTIADVAKGMHHIHGDIRDLSHLHKVIAEFQPQIVFHLAAQSLVQHSYEFPVETYATNVLGTVNVLEAARNNNVKVVINVTSDKCYENKEWAWSYRENEPLGGHDPYSNSKACAELVSNAYRRSFFKAIATARAGNVIGGGDFAKNRLIPDMVRAFINNEQVPIRNPEAIRPWQHVLEPLRGYLLLAEKVWDDAETYGDAWNFGPVAQDVQPVRYMADHFSRMWGEGVNWMQDKKYYAHEATTLKLDIAKANTRLNWYPRLNLMQGLEYVTSWYKAWQQQKDMHAFTLGQVEQYCEV